MIIVTQFSKGKAEENSLRFPGSFISNVSHCLELKEKEGRKERLRRLIDMR